MLGNGNVTTEPTMSDMDLNGWGDYMDDDMDDMDGDMDDDMSWSQPCDCEAIANPRYYNHNCIVKELNQTNWELHFHSRIYDTIKDETIFLYELTAYENAIEFIQTLRLQLPCSCLIGECPLMQISRDTEPRVVTEAVKFLCRFYFLFDIFSFLKIFFFRNFFRNFIKIH